MPEGRQRYFNGSAAHMKVAFIAEPNNGYTGIFKGANNGIMRIFDADSAHYIYTLGSWINPGVEIKFLRDSRPSADAQLKNSIDGTWDSPSLPNNRMSSILPESKSQCFKETIGKKLADYTEYVGATSLLDWGLYDQEANYEYDNNYPYRLDF